MFMLFLVFEMYSKVIWKYSCIHKMLAIRSECDGWTKIKVKLAEFSWLKAAEIWMSRNKIVDQWYQVIDRKDSYQLKNHTFVQILKDCQKMTNTFTYNWPPICQLSSKRGYFLQKWLQFSSWCLKFEPPLGCEYPYLWNQSRTEKEAITIQLIFILKIKLQKEHFSEKCHIFSARDASILCPY